MRLYQLGERDIDTTPDYVNWHDVDVSEDGADV